MTRCFKICGTRYEASRLYNGLWCVFVTGVGYLKADTLEGLKRLIRSSIDQP